MTQFWRVWILWLVMGSGAFATERIHWEYDGIYGPQSWGELAREFAQCGEGVQQSPIDIRGAMETDLRPIEVHWKTSTWEVENTGHTIKFKTGDAGFTMFGDDLYRLTHFQFHNPSEHLIEGLGFPMEAHFHHRSDEGDIAIIGVLIKGGGDLAAFDAMMGASPVKEGSRGKLERFNPNVLLTDLDDIYRYQGSQTSPPCAEDVTWTILQDPLRVSNAALLAFNVLFPMNARPAQNINRRFILTD